MEIDRFPFWLGALPPVKSRQLARLESFTLWRGCRDFTGTEIDRIQLISWVLRYFIWIFSILYRFFSLLATFSRLNSVSSLSLINLSSAPIPVCWPPVPTVNIPSARR